MLFCYSRVPSIVMKYCHDCMAIFCVYACLKCVIIFNVSGKGFFCLLKNIFYNILFESTIC